jgi:hypothetical protein
MLEPLKFLYKKAKNFFNKNSLIIPFFAFTVFIISQVFIGINKNGRWQFAEFYSMAEKFLMSGKMYCDVLSGEFDIQSLYFPGMPFLIMPFIKFTNFNPSLILMIIVVLSFSLLFYSIKKITNQLNTYSPNNIVFLIIGFIIFFNFFMFYLTEGKPDPFLISSAVFLSFIIYNILNYKLTFINVFALIIIAYFCGILKQQSVSLYFALSLFCLFAYKYSLLKRMILISIIGLSGLMVLITIINIENSFFYTIEVPSTHKLSSLRVSGVMFLNELRNSWLYIAVVMTALVTNKKLRDVNSLEYCWFLCCLCFGLMSFVSFLKEGGNEGNLQTGLISFLPFFCQGMSRLFQLKNNFLTVFLNIILFITIGQNIILCYAQFTKYHAIKEDNKVIQKYLSENFKGQKIGYASSDYWVLRKANVIPYPNIDTYNNSGYIINQKEIKIENTMNLSFGRLSNIDYQHFNEVKIKNLNNSRSVFIRKIKEE